MNPATDWIADLIRIRITAGSNLDTQDLLS